MTLCLTWLTYDLVVSASDARISYGSGRYRDDARKLIFYSSPTSRIIVSYSGLAEFLLADGTQETFGQWLSRILPSLDRSSVDAFAATLLAPLKDAIDSTVRFLPGTDPRICVVFTGFVQRLRYPLVIWLSNYEDPLRGLKIGANYGVRTLDPVAPQFEAGELKARSIVSTAPSCVLIHGDHTAVDPEAQAMLQRLGIQLSNGGHAAAALLAETIQFIADKRGGTTISPNCWTHSVSRQNPFSPIGKHFRDPQLQTPQPLLISPGGLIQGTISQELPGYEAALDRLKRGLTTDKLVGAMLAAYLDWSPTIAELCAEFERQCVDVGSDSKMPYVPDYLSLFEFSGYTTPYTLERHLESANPWLSELAAEYAKVAGAEPSKRAGIQRRRAVALLLAALNPQKYPTERPRSSLPPLDDLSFMPWPIDEQTLSLVREFHRRRSGGHP